MKKEKILEKSLREIALRNKWDPEKLISELALCLAYTNECQLNEFVHTNKHYWEDK